jgi:hypothetical protein
MFDEEQDMQRIVENFVHTGSIQDGEVKLVRLPDNKTTFVEQLGASGRSVFMAEYRVDDKVVWAGYSSDTHTVYISAEVLRSK